MAGIPNYISRAQWGALPPREKPVILLASRVDTVVFHYSSMNAERREQHTGCPAVVRSIQRFHQQTRGWNDIAYNYLVCQHGYVFEGRGLENKSAATGADNNHTLAVCFLGGDQVARDDVTSAGRQAMVDITRYIRTRRPACRYTKGHRDFMATSCPGDEIYKYVTGKLFELQVSTDEKSKLRKQILAWHAAGWGWARIKQTPVWRRFRELGGT